MGHVDLVIRKEGNFTRRFAMKRLHPHMQSDEQFRQMFLDEARIAGLIQHPYVVSVVDVGEDEGGPFLAMDYVEGLSLGQIIVHAGSQGHLLPIALCLKIVRQSAQGLQAAHELTGVEGEPLDLVHRDVSPHNILVGFDGIARVTDFGIAKALGQMSLTMTGVLKGKAGYMSPEQLRFENVDHRADIFSLGVVLFEALTLERLYGPKAGRSQAELVIDAPLPDVGEFRDDVPGSLVGLLFSMLAKDKTHRPQSMGEVVQAIDDILLELGPERRGIDVGAYIQTHFTDVIEENHERVLSAVALAEQTMKRSSRTKWLTVAAACIALAATGVAVAYQVSGSETATETAAQTTTGNGTQNKTENGNETENGTGNETGNETENATGTENGTGTGNAIENENAAGTENGNAPEPKKKKRRARKKKFDIPVWRW